MINNYQHSLLDPVTMDTERKKQGADGTAEKLWNEYKNIKKLLRQESIDKFHEQRSGMPEDISGSQTLLEKGISLFQGERARKGTLINGIIYDGYKDFFSTNIVNIEKEVKLTANSKRDMDVVIELPRGKIFISITTIPQERKDGTWEAEQNSIFSYKQIYNLRTQTFFLPVFFESKTDASLEETQRKRDTLQSFLREGAEVVAIQDLKHHADVLRRLSGRFL